MVFKSLADSLFVAICHLDWLHGRKYGTVWYHPASSMFYLIFFTSLSVSGKIDWYASGFTPGSRVKPVLLGLLCAYREVLILRQHHPFLKTILFFGRQAVVVQEEKMTNKWATTTWHSRQQSRSPKLPDCTK
jgi:hypothetical protein